MIIIVIYLDFHSTKRALWLIDSWSRAPDQIQMYPDRDTIEQLLPARRIQQYVIIAWLNEKWRDLQYVLTSAWLLILYLIAQEHFLEQMLPSIFIRESLNIIRESLNIEQST